MTLREQDITAIYEKKLLLRSLSSLAQLAAHTMDVFGDAYSLHNYALIRDEGRRDERWPADVKRNEPFRTDGFASQDEKNFIDQLMRDGEQCVLISPLMKKIYDTINLAMSSYSMSDPGNRTAEDISNVRFVILRNVDNYDSFSRGHRGEHSQQLGPKSKFGYSDGYASTLGKHDSFLIAPRQIETVIAFNAKEVQAILQKPPQERGQTALDMMTDKVFSTLRDLTDDKIPPLEKGLGAVKKALGVVAPVVATAALAAITPASRGMLRR